MNPAMTVTGLVPLLPEIVLGVGAMALLMLGVYRSSERSVVLIDAASIALLVIAAGRTAPGVLLIAISATLPSGLVGTVLWRTKMAPDRRREGRGFVILAIVLFAWSELWMCSTRLQNQAARLGDSISQTLRNPPGVYGR